MVDEAHGTGVGVSFAFPSKCVILICILVIFVATASLMIFCGYLTIDVLGRDSTARSLVKTAGENTAAAAQLIFYIGEQTLLGSGTPQAGLSKRAKGKHGGENIFIFFRLDDEDNKFKIIFPRLDRKCQQATIITNGTLE